MERNNNAPVRLNTRVSKQLNDWLDKRSLEMGISKSALVAVSIENYRKETDVVEVLPQLLKKLEELGIDMSDLRQ